MPRRRERYVGSDPLNQDLSALKHFELAAYVRHLEHMKLPPTHKHYSRYTEKLAAARQLLQEHNARYVANLS